MGTRVGLRASLRGTNWCRCDLTETLAPDFGTLWQIRALTRVGRYDGLVGYFV